MSIINNKYDEEYQSFLKKRHAALNTPDSVLNGIVRSAVGGDIASKRRVIGGEVNEVYDIALKSGGSVIVRISREEVSRFAFEKWAIDKCRDAGVPVPEVILLDEVNVDSERLHICVESKVSGISLDNMIAQGVLSRDELKALTIRAGEILSRIHSVKTEGFGEIDTRGVGQYKTWKGFILNREKEKGLLMRQAKKIGVNPRLVKKAFGILEVNKNYYADVKPRLAHADYGIKHILVADGEICGIIDFENCKSTDVVYDFSWWGYFQENRPPMDWLIQGYKKESGVGDDFEIRMHLTKIQIALDLIGYYEEMGHGFAGETTSQNLTNDLDFFRA